MTISFYDPDEQWGMLEESQREEQAEALLDLPTPFTQEELTASYQSIPAANLPPVPPQPKRVPIRLWTHRNALKGSSCRVIAQSRPIDDCNVEIHSDANGGWYVEVQS
jgi:hypothetical protein